MKEEDEEKINEEIKNFLSLKNNNEEHQQKKVQTEVNNNTKEISNLISMLETIEKTYSKINEAILCEDKEVLKDEILRDEIKMSLVSESLMRVLKEVCLERNEMKNKQKELNERIRILEDEKEKIEKKFHKNENDVEYVTKGNEELTRIIKDQKFRMQSYREKCEMEIRNCESLKGINEELEILRTKAMEKAGCLEKEIEVLKNRIGEKEQVIQELKEEIKSKKRKEEELKNRILELEKSTDILKRKNEIKDGVISKCNSELANLLSKDKRICSEMENLKERSSYYERLYKSTSAQNEYLNSQLAKMINLKNVEEIQPKEESTTTETTKESLIEDLNKKEKIIKKSEKRLRKKRREMSYMKKEIQEGNAKLIMLSEEVERLRIDNNKIIENEKKVTEDLLNKIEELLNRNHEYQNKIYEMKKEELRNNIHKKEISDVKKEVAYNFRENIPVKENVREAKFDLFPPLNLENVYDESFKTGREELFDAPPMEKKNYFNDSMEIKPNIQKNVNEKSFNEPMKEQLIDTYLKKRFFAKPIEKEILDDQIKNQRKVDDLNSIIPESLKREKKQPIIPEDLSSSSSKKLTEMFEKEESNPFIDSPKGNFENPKEEAKAESTTSSLRAMINRANNLNEKFNELDEQLKKIKNSNMPPAEKIHNQIKAYTNYYYTDILENTNEDDFI